MSTLIATNRTVYQPIQLPDVSSMGMMESGLLSCCNSAVVNPTTKPDPAMFRDTPEVTKHWNVQKKALISTQYEVGKSIGEAYVQ